MNCFSFRLYVKGAILGYRRGLRNQYHDTSLLKIENVQDKKASLNTKNCAEADQALGLTKALAVHRILSRKAGCLHL